MSILATLIKVKFPCSGVALNVLINKSKLTTVVYIKPYLTPDKQHRKMGTN